MVVTRNKKLPLNMARTFWSPVIIGATGAKVTVSGKDNVNPEKAYLVVSNHQSYLDIALLFRHLPVNLHFLGKEELRKMPFIGWFMRSMGMVFVDRSDRRKSLISLKKAGELITNGKSVMIFPEGTRSKTGKINRFKKGGFFIAQLSNAEILPVKIEGAINVWPRSIINIKPGSVKLTIGKPFTFSEIGEKDLALFANEVHDRVERLTA